MLLEATNYLPHQLLRDTDQMSMAHSLEVAYRCSTTLSSSGARSACVSEERPRQADAGSGVGERLSGSDDSNSRWTDGCVAHSRCRPRGLAVTGSPVRPRDPTAIPRHLWRRFRGSYPWSRPWSILAIPTWPAATGSGGDRCDSC